MKIYDFSAEYHKLCICGDIHGEFRTLMFNIKRLGIENSVIIVAGDCGIGFEKELYYMQLYNKLAKTLETTNNLLLLVRGNHDDPTYFNGTKIDFERMKCIPDYSVVVVAGRKVLCIGGAVSIDRMHRLETMRTGKAKRPLYWENEAADFNNLAFSELLDVPIDIVITHTCPSFCYPTAKLGIDSWLQKDATLQNDLDEERKLMDRIHQRLIADNHPLQNWYYAHFHESHTEFIDNISYSLLNIMDIKQVK